MSRRAQGGKRVWTTAPAAYDYRSTTQLATLGEWRLVRLGGTDYLATYQADRYASGLYPCVTAEWLPREGHRTVLPPTEGVPMQLARVLEPGDVAAGTPMMARVESGYREADDPDGLVELPATDAVLPPPPYRAQPGEEGA